MLSLDAFNETLELGWWHSSAALNPQREVSTLHINWSTSGPPGQRRSLHGMASWRWPESTVILAFLVAWSRGINAKPVIDESTNQQIAWADQDQRSFEEIEHWQDPSHKTQWILRARPQLQQTQALSRIIIAWILLSGWINHPGAFSFITLRQGHSPLTKQISIQQASATIIQNNWS